ncbi:MAG: S8 family serine peptidase [Candidatus Sericytochromatia bacterium]|nr:S8 family serine peptidase [Candidatus Sericytochromatia bacterium]
MYHLLSRFVAMMLSSAALVGCGSTGLAPSGQVARGLQAEASKAVLAKRLIVGFKMGSHAQGLKAAEKTMGRRAVKVIPKVAMAVFETRQELRSARAALMALPGVQFVEAELLPEVEPVRSRPVSVRPRQDGSKNDPLRKDQWYLDTLGVPAVWAAKPNLKTIKVAVVDTGVDLQHPELSERLVSGWNAQDPGQPPQDQHGHGTMCAGLIAAVANNAQGIAGIAPNAKIVPVKVGNSASSVVDAMMWAADHAELITMSLSFKPNMTQYPTAVETTKRAAEYVMSKGVPMVCSMGNTGSSSRNVPSAFAGNEVPNLIAVGATDQNDRVTSFSTYGNWCSVSAPGADIITTAKGGGYKSVDGTSFSTPITAGVVALMLGAGQSSNPGAVKKRLQETAVDIGAPGPDDKAGAGRVSAERAVL